MVVEGTLCVFWEGSSASVVLLVQSAPTLTQPRTSFSTHLCNPRAAASATNAPRTARAARARNAVSLNVAPAHSSSVT